MIEFYVPDNRDNNLKNEKCLEQRKKDASGSEFLLESLGNGKYTLETVDNPLTNIQPPSKTYADEP